MQIQVDWITCRADRPSADTLGYLCRIDEKLDRIEGRLDGVEGRLGRIEGRLDRVQDELLARALPTASRPPG